MSDQPITDQELDEIEARCNAATPGPWIYDERVGCVAVYHGKPVNCMDESKGRQLFYAEGYTTGLRELAPQWNMNAQDLANADFIAHSRTYVPRLIAEVRRLRAELQNAEPVRHGRWVFDDDGYLRCESCYQKAPSLIHDNELETTATYYCHHCGAKMDAGQKGGPDLVADV